MDTRNTPAHVDYNSISTGLVDNYDVLARSGDRSEEPALGYWLGQPYWDNGYAREAVAAIIDYGLRTLGMPAIRAYTDPANLASQKVLSHCGLARVGEIELVEPIRHVAGRAPLFRISPRVADKRIRYRAEQPRPLTTLDP